MRKKSKINWKLLLSLGFVTFASLLGVASFSVYQGLQKKDDVLINNKMMSSDFIKRFNNKQIYLLNKFRPFLINDQNNNVHITLKNNEMFLNNQKILLSTKNLFNEQLSKQEALTKNGIFIGTQDVTYINKKVDAQKTDINTFFNEYKLEDIKNTADYFSWLDTTLPNFYKKNYDLVGLETFADIQSILFKISYDIHTGFFNDIYSSDFLQGIFFDFSWIRARSWLRDPLQKEFIEMLLLTYINSFNTDAVGLDIEFNDDIIENYDGDLIGFKLKLYDQEGNQLVREENQNKTFYLMGFRNYKYNKKYGVGEKLKEENIFNEYLVNPVLKFRYDNLFLVSDINSFINNLDDPRFISGRGLNYFLNKWGRDLIQIDVPEYKKNTDLAYNFIESEITNYFGTQQVLRAKIEILKRDGTKEYWWWLSSDFDDHGHKLKGMITDLLNQQIINEYDKHTPMFNPPKNFFNLEFGKLKKVNFQSPNINDFFNSNLFKAILEASDKSKYNQFPLNKYTRLWNGKIKADFEASWVHNQSLAVKYLETLINFYSLEYALNISKDNINTGLYKIQVEVLPTPYKAGVVELKLHFLDKDNNELLNQENQNTKIYWNGFKGFDETTDVSFTFVR
ncbi:MAG3240 family lipoprotein [[Mycoplasma] gypis]|uniref:DUF31 domain-containing protein n=1 Tax=[Mycoplasma] gypis TaxID=92404 RepID=A0ABZ2RQN8_9BACT|nr:hypothetical protein [[Mycoplasma] gypis]MBN0919485.1 hypothetical protein [[Mycoplasma] gypis]